MCLCVHVASFFNLRVHLATLDKSRQVSCLCPPRRDKTNLRVLYVHACTHNHTLCSALAATIVGYFKKKHTHTNTDGSWPILRNSGQRGQNTIYVCFALCLFVPEANYGADCLYITKHKWIRPSLYACCTGELSGGGRRWGEEWGSERQQAAVCVNMGKCVWIRVCVSVHSGIESCSSAYGSQSCVQCVFYELIKAAFEAKRGETMEGRALEKREMGCGRRN